MGFISERNNTKYYLLFLIIKLSISYKIFVLPYRPNVPNIIPNIFADFAFSISAFLIECIYSTL